MCRSAVNDGSCSPWVMCSCSVVSGNQIRDNFEPIYVSGVKMKMNAKINNNKSSDKKRSLNAFKHVFNSENC